MLSFRHIRLLAAATVALLAFTPASVEAATKSSKKGSSSKSSKSSKNTSKKIAKKAPSTKSTTKTYAKTPPKHIDITKLQPAESLYRKQEAEPPASRSLSFFGSLASSYRYDSRLMRAAEIATARAYAHSRGTCWRYVKNALLDAGVVDSRPKTGYAKEAAWELTNDYGFRKISCTDPYKAPVGSVIVYGGKGAGHVEIRTKTGFVSDFWNARANKRPLIGVYVKP